jgi:hypothetical protein
MRKKQINKRQAKRRQTRSPRTAPRERMSPLARASGAARALTQRARLSAFHRGACGSDRTPPLNSSYALPGTELGRSGRYPLPAVHSAAGCPAVPVVEPDGRKARSRPGAQLMRPRPQEPLLLRQPGSAGWRPFTGARYRACI